MLTLLLVSADRHSAIVRRGNGNARAATGGSGGGGLLPMRWAVALAWAISVGLVLPYSAYIKYIDLSVSGDFMYVKHKFNGSCSREVRVESKLTLTKEF